MENVDKILDFLGGIVVLCLVVWLATKFLVPLFKKEMQQAESRLEIETRKAAALEAIATNALHVQEQGMVPREKVNEVFETFCDHYCRLALEPPEEGEEHPACCRDCPMNKIL